MKRHVLLAVVLPLVGCASFQPAPNVQKSGSTPIVGSRQVATVGDVIASEYEYSTRAGAILIDSVPRSLMRGYQAVQSGTMLSGGLASSSPVYCTGISPWSVCFQDQDNDGRFEHVLVWNGYGILNSPIDLAEPAAYRVTDAPNGSGFKYELLYEGRSGNVLNISYREFMGDMARPAFQQDLHYTLDASGAADVAFRAVRMHVYGADNQAINYTVTSGFAR